MLLVAALVAGCAPVRREDAHSVAAQSPGAHATASPTLTASPIPQPSPSPPRALRVFVASEAGKVWVLEDAAGQEFTVTAKIVVGAMPHNLAVSPDGRWVVAANRMANSVSIIDPFELREVARVGVGRQPHDLTFDSAGRALFVGHEQDLFIARLDVETWTILPPLRVGVPQHDLAIDARYPSDLYYSLTNTAERDVLRVWHLDRDAVTKIAADDVHDVFYVPDASEVWSASSGFLDRPSDRVVIYDTVTKKVKETIRFAGRYPFHTMKRNRDGMFFPADPSLMVLSDHAGPSLLYVDWRARRVAGETAVGPQPFHTTYDPIGDRYLVTSNRDGMVRVIDRAARAVTQQIAVPKAHGIVAVGLR